jgi:hypothetical protein
LFWTNTSDWIHITFIGILPRCTFKHALMYILGCLNNKEKRDKYHWWNISYTCSIRKSFRLANNSTIKPTLVVALAYSHVGDLDSGWCYILAVDDIKSCQCMLHVCWHSSVDLVKWWHILPIRFMTDKSSMSMW